ESQRLARAAPRSNEIGGELPAPLALPHLRPRRVRERRRPRPRGSRRGHCEPDAGWIISRDAASGDPMPDTRLPPWTRTQERLASPVIRLMTLLNVWAYRLTGGRLGGTFLRGSPVCLVT